MRWINSKWETKRMKVSMVIFKWSGYISKGETNEMFYVVYMYMKNDEGKKIQISYEIK